MLRGRIIRIFGNSVTMQAGRKRSRRVGLAAIGAGVLAWSIFSNQPPRASESASPTRPVEASTLVVAAEPITLDHASVPVGSVLIADNKTGRSAGASLTVRSLRGQSFEVPRVQVVGLRMSGPEAELVGRAGTSADDDIPPLIRRQPRVVHDAWRQIATAVAANQGLSRPRPEPFFARAELWMMVGNYDAALRDLLLAMRIASDTGVAPRVYDAIFQRLREVLERYDATPVLPEDGEPLRHYGHGMHSFWAGRYVEADESFADAISLAPSNPLYWYMRAVTRRRLGNEGAAKHDALLGAAAERKACSRRDGASLDINRGLRRLQGSDRIWLEDYRRGNPSRRTMAGISQ